MRGVYVEPNSIVTKKRTSELDALIGLRIKMKRIEMGMPQHELAEYLGMTFQQLQKYEKGINRVSAANLYKISKIFEVPFEYFFADFDEKIESLCDSRENEYSVIEQNKEEADAVLHGYFKLRNKGTRKKFLNFLNSCEHE